MRTAGQVEASGDVTRHARRLSVSIRIWCALVTPAVLVLLAVPAMAASPALNICYNYGCKQQAQFTPSASDWRRVVSLFDPPPSSPERERTAIRRAVAELESIAGMYTPVRRDRGGNPIEAEWPGQLDCIDESRNTTTYLLELERAGLLRWHTVGERVYRAPHLFDEHWSAQIRETASGQRYAVDSWTRDNGYPPYVQTLAEWKRKSPLPGER
jgi:hypothetical protein